MAIFNSKRARQLQALVAQNQDLIETVKMQALVINDVTTVTNLDTRYKGNAYPSYDEAVEELIEKYEGTADWGVLQTGNIIDLRAAFIAGAGLKIFPKDATADPAENEMEFAEAFLDANSLEREMVQEFAKEAELEGRFLGELRWDGEKGQVILRFLSWSELGYKIKAVVGDYAKFESVIWQENSLPRSLDAAHFVYARFGGRVTKADKPYPKVGKCLTQIDDLDKALRDWREINRLFAAPVPDVEYAEADQAKKGHEAADKMNFKVRKMFHHTGTFTFKSAPMDGATSIENEIITKAKMISGTTGVPVQFLGLPDIASIRSSESANTAELVSAATQKERLVWKGVYREIITKAMAIWNQESGKTKLDPSLVTVDIPYITADHWNRIRDIWLPLYTGSAISQATLLSQVPGIDVQAELDAKAEREQKMLDNFNRQPADGGNNNSADNQGDGNGQTSQSKDQSQGKDVQKQGGRQAV